MGMAALCVERAHAASPRHDGDLRLQGLLGPGHRPDTDACGYCLVPELTSNSCWAFSRNERARHHEKMGFDGRRVPQAVRYHDGGYDDELMMVLRLN